MRTCILLQRWRWLRVLRLARQAFCLTWCEVITTQQANDPRLAGHRRVFASPFWRGCRRAGPVILLTVEGPSRVGLHAVRPSRRRRGRCYLRYHAESGTPELGKCRQWR